MPIVKELVVSIKRVVLVAIVYLEHFQELTLLLIR